MTSWSQLVVITAATSATAVVLGFSAIYVIGHFYSKKNVNRQRKATVKKNVPGLYNLGNTCFANALIQSLAACPSFELWLSNVSDLVSTPTCSLLMELRSVISSLNHASDEGLASADGVLAALRCHRWQVTPDIEQDLYELFNVFVTTWDEELTPIWSGKAFTLADVSNLDELSSKSHQMESLRCISELVRCQHEYRAPCAGLLGTEFACRNCGIKNVRHDRFCSLDLVLPKTKSFMEISIETCLRKYFAQEILLNYKCEHCQAMDNNRLPSKRPSFVKKQGISKLPDCLILRINRVSYLPCGESFKHVDHVDFSETLCVNDFMFYREKTTRLEKSIGGGGDWIVRGGRDVSLKSFEGEGGNIGAGDGFALSNLVSGQYNGDLISNINRYMYNLRAVAVHIGRPDSGHFVTYRRGWTPNVGDQNRKATWFYTSDTEVKKVSFDEVASREAYMLFYERATSG